MGDDLQKRDELVEFRIPVLGGKRRPVFSSCRKVAMKYRRPFYIDDFLDL
jgi:hypothetical protein